MYTHVHMSTLTLAVKTLNLSVGLWHYMESSWQVAPHVSSQLLCVQCEPLATDYLRPSQGTLLTLSSTAH